MHRADSSLRNCRKCPIVREHYENNGVAWLTLMGRQVVLIASADCGHSWTTAELASAEVALSDGITYLQDALLGRLWRSRTKTRSHCQCN